MSGAEQKEALVEELPELTSFMRINSVETYRDGGSLEVTLHDNSGKTHRLWFDGWHFGAYGGRLYLKTDTPPDLCPIAQDSAAERQVVNLLRSCLVTQETVVNANLLRQHIERVEELRKLAVFGVIPRQ